jgi:hypothetical protein
MDEILCEILYEILCEILCEILYEILCDAIHAVRSKHTKTTCRSGTQRGIQAAYKLMSVA